MTPILPPNGRVVAYVVGLENYGKVGGIETVEYARRDAEAFADVLETMFPGKTIDLESRIDVYPAVANGQTVPDATAESRPRNCSPCLDCNILERSQKIFYVVEQ